MKRLMSMLLAATLFLGGPSIAEAKSKDNITVYVDGLIMSVVGHPAVLDEVTGRVLIPFKSLFLAIGVEEKDIKWDSVTSTAKGSKDGISVELTKNDRNAIVNGKVVVMDNAPIIMGSSMMVPLSFVTNQMGGATIWKGNPDYIVEVAMSSGLFPGSGNTGDPGGSGNAGNTKAPAKDTSSKQNELQGTHAMQNMARERFVAQFRGDGKLDIKNVTSNKSATGTYTVSGSSVTIKSDLLTGTYNYERTTYAGSTYYVLSNSDSSKTVAMTSVTYDEFASVY